MVRSIPFRLVLLSLLSSLLQNLCFPLGGPIPVWRAAFCWIALVPLLAALKSANSDGSRLTCRQSAALGYLCGTFWYLGNCYWIYQTMYLYGGLAKPIAVGILLLFALYLGLYHALFTTLLAVMHRSKLGSSGTLLLSPLAWVAVELARARITGFPWDLLGVAQVDNPLLTRLAPVTGVYGISFVIVAVNALWLVRIRLGKRRVTRPALTLAGVFIVLCYSLAVRWARLPTSSVPVDSAVLLQENLGVGAESSSNLETRDQMLTSFTQLSLRPPSDRCLGIPELASTRCIHRAEGEPETRAPSLIAWPESPAGFRTNAAPFTTALRQLAHASHASLVIGSLGIAPDLATDLGFREYDSAALLTPDGNMAGRYDKIHLVPWGEYVPFRKLFSFADRLTAGVGDMDRGTERSVFSTGGHNIGVFICYESIFGDEVRQFVRNGAEVLVNISDDGWYGDTSAAWQHLNMVRMRAIENRRWILRSTNTGVTAAIDPYGRVTASVPRHLRTALQTGFNFEGHLTFYSKYGDLFAYACAVITVCSLTYAVANRGHGLI